MDDIIVTIRMPRGLSEELKRIARTNHFMDVSEAVRSILRRQYFLHVSEQESADRELLSKLKRALEGVNETKG